MKKRPRKKKLVINPEWVALDNKYHLVPVFGPFAFVAVKKQSRRKKHLKNAIAVWIENGCEIHSAIGKIPQQEFLKQISKPK